MSSVKLSCFKNNFYLTRVSVLLHGGPELHEALADGGVLPLEVRLVLGRLVGASLEHVLRGKEKSVSDGWSHSAVIILEEK